MPYKSKKQRAFMHAKHPKIAAKWDREGAKIGGGKTKAQKVKAKKKA